MGGVSRFYKIILFMYKVHNGISASLPTIPAKNIRFGLDPIQKQASDKDLDLSQSTMISNNCTFHEINPTHPGSVGTILHLYDLYVLILYHTCRLGIVIRTLPGFSDLRPSKIALAIELLNAHPAEVVNRQLWVWNNYQNR